MIYKNILALVFALNAASLTALLAHAHQPSPEEIYNSLTGELSVLFWNGNSPIAGISVTQKNNPAGRPSFCRRTSPVVPNPTYTFECYYQTKAGASAEALYAGSNAQELNVTFRSASNGGSLLGTSWSEKYIGAFEATICTKTKPVVPHAVATYRCYSKIGGIGGAISGGN